MEDLNDTCLVAFSYGGISGLGAIEQIGNRISAVVWLDAFKPTDGQKVVDFTGDAFRTTLINSAEKGELSFPVGGSVGPVFVNENDVAFVNAKVGPQPINTYLQPIKLSGALEKIAKRTYIRVPRWPSPANDKALAECKADKSWNTFEITNSGHAAMLDQPDWLTDRLLEAA